MTLFEILNFNRELLERLTRMGFKPDDYKYIDLYKEYEQMRRQGDKVTYCVAVLSIRHGVCERKIYEIVGRFKGVYVPCSINAVRFLFSWEKLKNFAARKYKHIYYTTK